MNRILRFALLVLSYSCSNSDIASHDAVSSKSNQKTDTAIYNVPDFLKLVNTKSLGFRGYFQGVGDTDSAGPYVFNEYFSDTLSFRLVYVPLQLDKKDVTFDSIAAARHNNFKDYLVLSFVYPMTNPDYVKNDNDQIKFPVTVATYVRKSEKWQLLSKLSAKDLTELSQYEIRCIRSALE